MRFGVVVFPGSNCDADCFHVVDRVLGQPVEYLWHGDEKLKEIDCLILPGGFSYGDYLRTGAIARFSPLMNSVMEYAEKGGLILGICNGFQILTEMGLLPGALIRNPSLQFQCQDTYLRVERADTPFTGCYAPKQVVKIPIAHAEGSFVADKKTLDLLEKEGRVVFRYSSPGGEITAEANPNGSLHNIAGIINEKGNVLGMMPHPERCSEGIMGGVDGLRLFESLVKWWEEGGAR
ncbi:MAG: phosphoribosylformylglycinamidine synthase subunit PurQ [Peptococcaceae bacterium]|nr:phosphoribosylformylglycinamidine synthase subunit PurQ [Peptococcaceae bacterium]MDH7526410.1 phosphoribosylformylglycinamidine synthase subunit PurQ [Peptococcaceae bacterium]